MKNTFLKQVIIGLAALLLSIGFFIFSLFVLDTTNRWFNYILVAISAGCFFGSLLYMFGGKEMFFYGGKLGVAFVAFTILVKELPGFWRGIFIVICALMLMAVPVVKEYLFDREKNLALPGNKKIARRIKEQEELERELEAENKKFLFYIAFGEKSLLLRTSSGEFYQCIKGKDKFYFIYVGGELSGINLDLIKMDFSDEGIFVSKKKDYVINKNDISYINYKADKIQNFVFNNSGFIVMECGHFKKRFQLLETISVESVRTFFDGIRINITSKAINKEINESLGDNVKVDRDKALIARLKLICTMLTVASVTASSTFLFLIINYKVMSLLCMALFISIFVLYVKYNDIISLADEKNQETFTKGRINITFLILIPSIGLGLRSILDFNLVSYKMFAVWSLLFFSALLFIFFGFTNEYKRRKSSILVMIMAALFFAPSAVAQTNYVFDFSKAAVSQSQIYGMRISENSNSPDEYLIEVMISNSKKIELDISKEYYKRLSIGDTVNIAVKEGALKIPYAFVKEAAYSH
ncbi:MAG: hypothetical protein ACOYWZ_07800 [Bacillota bacterium]